MRIGLFAVAAFIFSATTVHGLEQARLDRLSAKVGDVVGAMRDHCVGAGGKISEVDAKIPRKLHAKALGNKKFEVFNGYRCTFPGKTDTGAVYVTEDFRVCAIFQEIGHFCSEKF